MTRNTMNLSLQGRSPKQSTLVERSRHRRDRLSVRMTSKMRMSQNSSGSGNGTTLGGPEATASGFRRNRRGCSADAELSDSRW
jgi:hypothetical protein